MLYLEDYLESMVVYLLVITVELSYYFGVLYRVNRSVSDSVSTGFFVYVTSNFLNIAIWIFFSPVIENLPVEMRERLTEMRETDLQVQSKFFDIFKIACVFCPLIAEQFCFSPSRHYLPWRILVCCKRLFPLCRIPDRTVRRHVLCLSCLFLFSKEAVGFF